MTREERKKAINALKVSVPMYATTQEEFINYRQALNKVMDWLEQEPKTGHWKLVQRGKSIDICCSNCEAVRIKGYAYNYTIDQLSKEDLEECFECAEMRYCPHCGADMREADNGNDD